MAMRSHLWATKRSLCSILPALLLFIFCGCNDNKIYTVAIATWDVDGNRTLAGFRAGMAGGGYVEGETIRYVYELIPEGEYYDGRYIASRLKDLVARDPDILVTMGLEVSLEAKALAGGTDLAVLFSGNIDPVEYGFTESLLRPGGNLTGVRFSNTIPKALEWLTAISGEKKIYVPFNPGDNVSIECLEILDETADRLGDELVRVEVSSVEEAIEAIENLPADAGGVFRVPSPLLDPRSSDLSQAAIRRRIATCAPHTVDDAILATFANDEYGSGKVLARLAQQINKGAEPSELPVETIEAFLTINLQTAEKIGLEIPEDVLVQAREIIH